MNSFGFYAIRFKILPAETIASQFKNHGIIKNPVQCAEECIIFTEVFPPRGWLFVAGENHIVASFLVVTSVYEVKEKLCIFLIKLAMSYLINNKAGWSYQISQEVTGCILGTSAEKFISEFTHLDEISL